MAVKFVLVDITEGTGKTCLIPHVVGEHMAKAISNLPDNSIISSMIVAPQLHACACGYIFYEDEEDDE